MTTIDEDLIETTTAYLDARLDDDNTRAAMALSLLPGPDLWERSFAFACGLAHVVLGNIEPCPDCGCRELRVFTDAGSVPPPGVASAVEILNSLGQDDRAAARLFATTLEPLELGQAIAQLVAFALPVRHQTRSGGAS